MSVLACCMSTGAHIVTTKTFRAYLASMPIHQFCQRRIFTCFGRFLLRFVFETFIFFAGAFEWSLFCIKISTYVLHMNYILCKFIYIYMCECMYIYSSCVQKCTRYLACCSPVAKFKQSSACRLAIISSSI